MELDRGDRRRIVEDALASYSGKKTQSSYYTMICCPYHDDKTPSGQIFHGPDTQVMGYYICRGCGIRKLWNELAKDMGWPTFGKTKPSDKFVTMVKTLQTEASPKEEIAFDLEDLPTGRSWRSFPTEFLTKVGAKLGRYTESGRPFVYLPVLVGGRERGYIRAQIKKQGDFPSYLNKSGSWSKTHGLFPFDYSIRLMTCRDLSTMVLVEGPRDALRLLRYGIPAVSILGTQTWTAKKAKLLELHGVDRVIVMMDGDPAGQLAVSKIVPDLNSLVSTYEFNLCTHPKSPFPKWEKLSKEKRKAKKHLLWDPGNCPKQILRELKNLVYREKT